MTPKTPDRSTAEYIDAVIKKKPHIDDPKDQRIQGIIRERFLQETWAQLAFEQIKKLQTHYMREVVRFAHDSDRIHTRTQDTLRVIGKLLRSHVEDGTQYLEGLQKEPVLIVTNHLGTYKLSGINPQQDLGNDIETYKNYDFMYPYPLYFAALSPVADKLVDNLSYTSDDFPGVYGEIHSNAGFIHVPPPGIASNGRMENLKEQTAELLLNRPNTALVTFPEGGTSGKHNEAGPYDLLPFKTGAYVTAAQLAIPVVMVAQYFDQHDGMCLKVFPAEHPQADYTREDFQSLAARQQHDMQMWLSTRETL